MLNVHRAHGNVSNGYTVRGIDLRQCRKMMTSEDTVKKKCSGQPFPSLGWKSGFRKSQITTATSCLLALQTKKLDNGH